jgi:proline iminopeptidase
MPPPSKANLHEPREGMVNVERASLFVREIGEGEPVVVLHGGPDFDHTYLLPELDRLASGYRLIFYDQRGRGASAAGIEPEDVSLESEIADLDAIRRAFDLASVTLLGHSWGVLLALEYALRHPKRVRRLIMMNAAPVCHTDFLLFGASRHSRAPDKLSALQAIRTTPGFQNGEADAVAAYYQVHFRSALARPDLLEPLIHRLRASFTREGILKARAIEGRLFDQTWSLPEYDLLPAISALRMPALVLHGDRDFIPVECAAHIADALPSAHLLVLDDCGHFAYLEQPEQTETAVNTFMASG